MCFRAPIQYVPTFFHKHILLCINLSKASLGIVEKLHQPFLIKFADTDMHIIFDSDANKGGFQVWSYILFCLSYASPDIRSRNQTRFYITNYRIQSNANDEIRMVLPSEALLGALKSASSSPPTSSFETEEVVMRLAKKTSKPY